MITAETTIQTRRERRLVVEADARRVAKDRAAKTGRKVGVVLGASGLVLTSSVAAMASETTDSDRAQATLAVETLGGEERVSNVQDTTVSASAEVELAFDRPAVSSDPAAEPEPEPEPVAESTTSASTSAEGVQAAAGTAEVAAPSSSSVINAAYSAIGTPYQWAGSTRAGMDCSGFINWAYAQAGRPLPGGARSTHGMLASLQRVSTPQPGDIVVATGIRSQYHAGIYVGNGQMIGSLAASGVTTHGYHDSWHNVVAILRPY